MTRGPALGGIGKTRPATTAPRALHPRKDRMSLLERVATLLRANLNDLLDRAEDPEKLSRQILLDIENQLLQVKTQIAIAIADQHRLLKQQKENEEAQAEWRRKAELAVQKGHDDLARHALERSLSHERSAQGFARQLADQAAEAETLRSTYARLQAKLVETKSRAALLLSQHRRNKAATQGSPTAPLTNAARAAAHLSRLADTVAAGDNAAQTHRALQTLALDQPLDERFNTLEQQTQIDALLLELKQNQPRLQS